MHRLIEGPAFVWLARPTNTVGTRLAIEAVENKSFNAAATVEKLIGVNNLRPVAFLEKAVLASQPVARISVPTLGLGTGFLVGPDVLMTNNHVVPSAQAAAGATAQFGYELGLDGILQDGQTYALAPNTFFATSVDLDFSLVAVDGSPGAVFGYLIPDGSSPQVGDPVNIVQHPAGQPKQVAFVDNEIEYVDDKLLQYLTDTLPGSSGSPIFDDAWRLIGIHHSGGWIPEQSSGSTHFRNEGIRMSAIVAALKVAGLV